MSQFNSRTLLMLMGMAVASSFIGCSSDSQEGLEMPEEQELFSGDESVESEGEPVFPTPEEPGAEVDNAVDPLTEESDPLEEETTPEEEEITPEEEEITPEEEETIPEEEETIPEEEETIPEEEETTPEEEETTPEEEEPTFEEEQTITGPADEDGDGLTEKEDCDDLDASVGLPTAFFLDQDQDGFGDASGATEAVLDCEAPEGYVANDSDCDDTNDAVYPGATEHCDGINNDCDSSTSETNLITVIEESMLFGPNGQADPLLTTYTTQSDPNGSRTQLSFGKASSDGFTLAGGDVSVNVCAGTHYVDIEVTGAATIKGMNNSAKLSGSDEGTVITKTGSGKLKLVNLKIRDGFGSIDTTVNINGNPNIYKDVAGGIYCAEGELVLDDVLLSQNEANRGGGIFAHECDVKIKNGSVVSNNTAERFGGGVWIRNSTLTLDDTIVMLNEVGPSPDGNAKGGAVFIGNGEVVMTDSIFTSNAAVATNGFKGMGGAIALHEADLFCEGGSGVKGFSANEASYGYGSAISVKGESSTIVSDGCDFGVSDGTENPDPDIASDDAQCTWGGSCGIDYRFEWDGDGTQNGISSFEFDQDEDFECYWDSSVSCQGMPDSEHFSCSWKGLVCE